MLRWCGLDYDAAIMRWLRKKRVWVPVALVVLYILFGFFAAGPLARAQLEKRLPQILKRSVSIESIAINPLVLSVQVRHFSATEKDGSPFVAFGDLYVNIAATDFIRGIIGFNEIRLTRPIIGIAILKDGRLSFADLLESDGARTATPPDEKKAPRIVRVAQFGLIDGAVRFADLSRPTPFRAEVKPLTLNVTDFTTETRQEGSSPYTFNARLGPTSLGWNGDFVATPLHSRGELFIQGLNLASFNSYIESLTHFHVGGGRASIRSRYALDATPNGLDFVLEQTTLTIGGLALSKPQDDEPLFALDMFEARSNRIDLSNHTVALDAITLAGGSATVRRLANGAIELAELSSTRTPAGGIPEPSPSPPPTAAPAPEARRSAWSVSLPRFAIERFSVFWEDRALHTPLTVPFQNLTFEARDFELPFGKPFTVQLSTAVAGGQLTVSGPITLQPLTATLTFALKALSLPSFWPYAAEALDASLAAGGLDVAGTVTLAGSNLSVAADGALSGLELNDNAGAPMLTFDRLALEGIHYQSAAGSLELATLALAKARARIERDAKGQMNFSRLVKPPPEQPAGAQAQQPEQSAAAPESKPAQPGAPFSLKIGTLRFDTLRADLLDRSVKPHSALSLQRLSGRVQNITTPKLSTIRIDLTALVDGAPLSLNGTLKPAGKDSHADLKLTLGGYNLPLASSYAIKYVAQPIQKGKLSLEVKWRVENRQLEGQNRLRADQLEFGDRVANPGPDTTKLPLGLAVSILSDRSGLIDLDVPGVRRPGRPGFRVVQRRDNGAEKHPGQGRHRAVFPAGRACLGRSADAQVRGLRTR